MKKLTYTLTLLFVLTGFLVRAQSAAPVVQDRLTFADISVRLDPDARRIVQQDVNALLSNRQYWVAKLDRVALYFPMIEAILIDEDVPTDFKYLAVQESSLTPDAVSSSAAVGYWQFKRETATGYGMRVDDEIDERKSITASTHGAARYLKKSNAQFNNWIASLYSYYLGAGGIAKLIPPDWSYAREVALDGRTDRYILRFFAHKIAIENALQSHQANNRFALLEYPNGGGKSMRAIADELGVDEFELRKYNRWILSDNVPTDRAYVMAVPVPGDQINDVRQKIVSVSTKKTPDFVQNDVGFPVLKRITIGRSSKSDPVLFEINGLPGIQAQAGDNAASLARMAKMSMSSFLRYNDMSDRDPVIVNDVYYLAKKRKKALVPFHTVREDETARSISQRYGIRLKKLMRNNRLDRVQKLAVGRVMWLRERRPANKPVEIINAPTPPVYDQTPTPPTRPAEVAERNPNSPSGPNRVVNGLDGVPRNASERKMYQPKLVDGGVTPNDGTSEPATPVRNDPAKPAYQSGSSSTMNRPAPTTTSRSTTTDGSQRVVIVRTSDASQPDQTIPVATTPQPAADAPAATRPATGTTPKPTRSTDTYASNQPVRATPTVEQGRYEGPREQQADGSLTNVSPASRTTQPAVAKVDARPTTPAATKTERGPTERSPTERGPTETKATIPEPKPVTSPTPVVSRETIAPVSVNRSATTHMVEPGQTYYSISKLYGLTVEELLTLNNRTAASTLESGQKLRVKPATERETSGRAIQATQSGSTGTSSAVTYHTVAKGETMFRISKQYGVTVEQIQEWNNLTDVGLKEGQRIKIMKM